MKSPKKELSLVEAVQAVFDALESFDDGARQRILTSATSLLGMSGIRPHVGGEASLSPSHQAVTSTRGTADRPMSPVELIQDKQPATNPQRIALFAYYRERADGLARFAKDDLKPYFAKAKLVPPKNFDRDYGKAVKVGWIYDDGGDSYLTSKGLESVEAGFGGKGLPRGTPVAKKKKPRSKGRVRKS